MWKVACLCVRLLFLFLGGGKYLIIQGTLIFCCLIWTVVKQIYICNKQVLLKQNFDIHLFFLLEKIRCCNMEIERQCDSGPDTLLPRVFL